MREVNLTIDGMEVAAAHGMTILEAAIQNGIYIPHLCYHPELEPAGACRLCTVEIGEREFVPACLTPVEPGIVVSSRSSEVYRVVRPVVELLIADHHASCKRCPASGHCALQKVMAHLRIDRGRVRHLIPPQDEAPIEDYNSCFDYDPNRCVLCSICVRTCEATHKVGSLYFIGRGYGTRISFHVDAQLCESCRQCVDRCPVGALLDKSNIEDGNPGSA